MRSGLKKLGFTFIAMAIFAVNLSAQTVSSHNQEEDIPDNIREKLEKMRIEETKKEFNKLVDRAETVAKLSDQIRASYLKSKSLTAKDSKKLKEVYELLKKIRRELNAKKDKKALEKAKPKSLLHAINNLHKNTSNLVTEIKKATRHSISVAAIQSSNTVWSLVKFIRLKKP